jgi:hypothetical protein
VGESRRRGWGEPLAEGKPILHKLLSGFIAMWLTASSFAACIHKSFTIILIAACAGITWAGGHFAS